MRLEALFLLRNGFWVNKKRLGNTYEHRMKGMKKRLFSYFRPLMREDPNNQVIRQIFQRQTRLEVAEAES